LFSKKENELISAFSSILYGIILLVLIIFPSLWIKNAHSLTAAIWAYCIISVAIFLFSVSRKKNTKSEWISLLIIMALNCFIVRFNHFATTLGDASYMIMMGVDIARFGHIPSDVAKNLLWAFPLFLPIFQAVVSNVSDINNFINIMPCISISMAGILFKMIYDLFPNRNFSKSVCYLSIILPVFMFSSHHMFIQSLYYNHHLLTGLIILLLTLYYFKNENYKYSEFLFIILLISLNLMRFESVVISVLILWLFGSRLFEHKARFVIGSCYSFYSLALYTILFFWGSDKYCDLTILTHKKILLIISVLSVILAYHLMLLSSWFTQKHEKKLFILIDVGLIIIALSLMILNPKHLLLSWNSLGKNLFLNTGYWGITWHVILFVFLHQCYLKIIRLDDPLFKYIALFIAYVSFIVLIRKNPYRTGFGDSANRMMVHVLPTMLFYFTHNYFNKFRTSKNE
jgi:hypothetical protein